jgi:hypothetical protein
MRISNPFFVSENYQKLPPVPNQAQRRASAKEPDNSEAKRGMAIKEECHSPTLTIGSILARITGAVQDEHPT